MLVTAISLPSTSMSIVINKTGHTQFNNLLENDDKVGNQDKDMKIMNKNKSILFEEEKYHDDQIISIKPVVNSSK